MEENWKRPALKAAVLIVCLLGCPNLRLASGEADANGFEIGSQARPTFDASGRVTFNGKALPQVTITIERVSGAAQLVSVSTNAQGNWTATGFAPGTSFRATPTLGGFNFNPRFIEFNSPRTDLNFGAQPLSFEASGSVRLAGGISIGSKPPGIEGVEIVFERASSAGLLPASVRTDANGQWRQTGFQQGSIYRAMPRKQGFSFSPSTREFGGVPNVSLEFEGVTKSFKASGKLATADGRGIPGVRLRFSRVFGAGAVPAETQTGAQGNWSQTGFERGTIYRITPTPLAGAALFPRSIDNLTGPPGGGLDEVLNQNFEISLSRFNASGRVGTVSRGSGLASVRITFTRESGTGPVPPPVTTNQRGEWLQAAFEAGSIYKVTPSRGSFTFTPAVRNLASPSQGAPGQPPGQPQPDPAPQVVSGPTVTDVDFSVPDTFTVSGLVEASEGGRAVSVDLEIKVVGTSQRLPCVQTVGGRTWTVTNLEPGKTYEIIPHAFTGRFFDFIPGSATVDGPRRDVRFTGRPNPAIIERFFTPCR